MDNNTKISILKHELELNQIDIDNKWKDMELFWEELSYCIYPTLHENLIPTFGVIFVENIENLKSYKIISNKTLDSSTLRILSDGYKSYLLYERDNLIGLIFLNEIYGSEYELLRLHQDLNALILQRDNALKTKLFHNNNLYIHHNRNWLKIQCIYPLITKIKLHVPQIQDEILSALLEFAYYYLSPRNIGATIIYFIDDEKGSKIPKVEPLQDLAPIMLSILSDEHKILISNLLSQVDGATFFNQYGILGCTKIKLDSKDSTKEMIPEYKGTRHTSALRYSYEEAKSVVLTVSEDGPVSVFSDGVELVTISKPSSPDIQAFQLRGIAPHEIEDMNVIKREYVCYWCLKNLVIEECEIRDHEENIQVYCPVCGSCVDRFIGWDGDAIVVKKY
jgi:DNA integrity scanning protein DisA with diadenylate cyclase activity